jgi:tetratricopeptide (TPR) repeat protein
MSAVNITLLRTLYPSVQAQMPPRDPPLTHVYSRILRDVERGVYTPPQQNSTDYLEHVLPFLAYFPQSEPEGTRTPQGRALSAERFLATLPDLQKAERIKSDSVLAGYFMGIVYEFAGRAEDALSQYTRIWERFPECFPAALGIARVMDAQGRKREVIQFLQDMVIRFPDNIQVKRRLALAYYNSGDWSRAEPAVAEILQRDNRDGDFVLMRAHILIEQGLYLQAQAPLDIYAAINPNNRLYLFLRARIQYESFHNRDAALNYLRSILRASPGTADEASVYAVRLLMGSPRAEDQAEGRTLLRNLLANPNPSPDVLSQALEDAIRREAWQEARPYMTRLLEERRSIQDLMAAYTVEKEQGNNAAALSFARELYERDRTNEEGVISYISALIDTGRRDEAAGMIDSRINSIAGGALRSRYFYLRSRIRSNEELMMNDLRSSLFEDPRNLNAIISMFEIYHRRKDERRAVYYLKQALALAPDNPRLKRYEAEYAAALGSAF